MIRQIFIVSALNLRNLSQRFWQSMVIVVGLAATIGVLSAMNSLSEGMLKGYLCRTRPCHRGVGRRNQRTGQPYHP